METVGEKGFYERQMRECYGHAQYLLHHHIGEILTGGRKGVVVAPEITNAINDTINAIQDAVSYQIKEELAKHGISSVEGNET